MKQLFLALSILIVFGFSKFAIAEDGHGHGKEHKSHKKSEKHSDHDEHEEEKGHDSHDDEDDHDEEGHKHKKEDEHSSNTEKHENLDDDHSEHAENEEEHAHKEEGHGDHGDENHKDGEEKHAEHGEEGGHDEHETTGVGPDKAIRAFNESSKSFQLSPETVSLIGIKESGIESSGNPNVFKIPRSSVVEYQDKTGVFVLRDGWYQLIEIKIENKNDTYAMAKSKKLKNGDKVSVSGLGTLRSAYLQVTGQGGKGHAH